MCILGVLMTTYTAISVKRFHDIDAYFGFRHVIYCLVGSILWGLGALFYVYYMIFGGTQGPNKHGKSSLMSFSDIWNYEANEIATAVQWEESLGFKEAIDIYTSMSKSGDVRRVKGIHVAYLKKELSEKLSFMKKKGIDCTGLEISVNHLLSNDGDYQIK